MARVFPRAALELLRKMGLRPVSDALRYNVMLRVNNRRFAARSPQGPRETPGRVIGVEPQPRGAIIQAERAWIELYFAAAETVRVRLGQQPEFSAPFSYAVAAANGPAPTIRCQDEPGVFRLQSEALTCEIHKDACRLVFKTPDGRVISEDAAGMSWRGRGVAWSRRLPPEEYCCGLGQRASSLPLRGKRLTLWNADPTPYRRGADPVYTSIPFYLGVRPDLACGIFWDNPARGTVDLGAAAGDEMTFQAEDGELRFYLCAGPAAPAVLRSYTALTGRLPLPPLWALGFHQSRWGYNAEAVFRALATEFRQRRLPCDVLYFDIDYMDGYRCFTWDPRRFAGLPGLLAELRGQGFKSVAIIDPGIKVDPGYSVYQEGVRDDLFLHYPDGSRVVAPVWPGPCHFPDFTSPRVRAWWAGHIAALAQAGFAGFWNDMNEPAVINFRPGATLADYVRHDWEGRGAAHVQGGHNVYGMLMARSTREGLQQAAPDRRPFVMTRAAYAGAQRYTSSWTGDNGSTWDHLRLCISMTLNMGLSGMAFTGPDVGGFVGEPDGELFTRWMQVGSMMPYFRVHSALGTAPQEPWSFGEPYTSHIRAALERRYQLLPTLYTAFAQCAQEGTPVLRPMFMADPQDDALRDRDDQFMLGDALLVAPVVEPGAVRRQVYLPKGVWYEYRTGKLIDGAQTVTAEAPLDVLPLYVLAGSVIPLWPVMQYVGEQPVEELRLRVFAGNGASAVYEDAGEGLAYQQGESRWSYFSCRFLPSGQFGIGWRRAGRYTPPYGQVRIEVVGISGEPESVILDGQAAPVWYYEGGVVEFIVQPFSEARLVGRGRSGPSGDPTLAHRPRR